jgi:predicted PurR-regulated permease PerM
VGIVPLAVKQVRQLGESLPILLERAQGVLQKTGVWLESRGLAVSALKEGLFGPVGDAAAALVTRAMGAARSVISGLSKVVLSPLLAFYLLRDRRKISAGLTLLLPVSCRARGVRAAREMKRESAAYLRGQLLISLIVGSMTALGLLLLKIPGWLLLGVLMGVMELVPYIGPVIAGIPAVLLALQGGWVRALWTAALLLFIQETEGAFLSPRLVGHATALHPMAVLLMVSAGGIMAGPAGMVLAIPLAVSLRGAVRGWRE